jgi:D-sedoheptulose 7-phosphate isomerase
LFSKGDVLVVISASGNSPNVIAAVKQAKEMGGKTIGLVGFDGGELLEMCDYVIHVKAKKGEYGPVEDIHMIIDHMVTSFLAFKLMIEKVKAK